MRRTATARSLALALAAAAGSTATAGEIPVNRWLNPVSGDWNAPALWSLDTAPGATGFPQHVVIDAVGDPYTVMLTRTISAGIETLTLDSPDATLSFSRGRLVPSGIFQDTGFRRFDIRAGTLLFDRDSFGSNVLAFADGQQSNRVGQLGAIRVGDTRRSTASFFGAVDNEGLISIGEDSSIDFGSFRGSTGLVNNVSGRIELADDASIGFEVFHNHGTIRAEGDARFGMTFGGATPYFENHGVIDVDGGMIIDASAFHAGEIRATEDSTVEFRGSHFFADGSSLTGGGVFRFDGAAPLAGSLGGNARLRVGSAQTIAAHITGDVSLTLENSDSIEFMTRFDGGGLRVEQSVGSATFTAPITASGFSSVNADLTIQQTLTTVHDINVYGASALFAGPVLAGSLDLTVVYDGNRPEAEVRFASTVGVSGDVFLTGIANRGAIFDNRLTIGGSLTATGATFNGFVAVDGNATFNAPSTSIARGIEVGGRLVFNGGQLDGPVSAQSVLLDRSLGVQLFSSVITADTVTVRGAELQLQRSLHHITGDLEMELSLETFAPRLQANARYFASQDQLFGTSILVGGDATLTGDLEVLLASSSDPVPLGASFTLIDAGGTITGEFDRLFLPTLPGELFFDIVYEPHAVRLVVVPTPASATAFSLFGVAAALRRRRAKALAGSAHPV
ncbi:MAG: hypothetical protein ACTS27_00010 [Phycisphaerales bacterium]